MLSKILIKVLNVHSGPESLEFARVRVISRSVGSLYQSGFIIY